MDDGRVTIISDTVQEFQGERFYLCGSYFQHNGKRLHRAVWELYNGSVPDGYHIHHEDGNRHNNQIENLRLMPEAEHIMLHAKSEERREQGRKAIAVAIMMAPEWHKSEEGREWHRQHGKDLWAGRTPYTRKCTMCGAEYETRDIGHNSGNHFCGNNCRAKYRRWRLAGKI